jgi:hypothetical protein
MKDFDGKTVELLPDEYRVKHATGIAADTLGSLPGSWTASTRPRFSGRCLRSYGTFLLHDWHIHDFHPS